MLAASAKATPREISGRCTPTYFTPDAQPTSNSPATTRTSQGLRDRSQDMAAEWRMTRLQTRALARCSAPVSRNKLETACVAASVAEEVGIECAPLKSAPEC